MLENLKILYHQGKQYIPDVTKANVPGIFKGRPLISLEKNNKAALVDVCPMDAISSQPLRIDLGKCTFWGECAKNFPNKIQFTNDYKLSTNQRERLIITEGVFDSIKINESLVRKEIHKFFGGSLKLRQVSAAGDNSCELELNA